MEISEHRFTGLFKRAFISLSIIIFFISFNFKDTPPPFGWYQQFLPNLNGKSISDITFLDSLTGWSVANQSSDSSYILKTTNGGDDWQIIYRQLFAMTRIQFLNLNTGFVCGGYLYKTTNSGFNWNQISTPAMSAINMHVLNNDTIWIIDDNSLVGGVFLTTNGGLNWTQQYSAGSDNPNKIYMVNARIGFISKITYPLFNNLRKTTNGGINWSSVNNDGFRCMHFIDSLIGWKCTGGDIDSTMKKTTDGGLTWVKQNLNKGIYNISQGISNFSTVNKDTIWGVGSYILYPNNQISPVLWRTTNGGNNWAIQIPDTSIVHLFASYNFVFFINKSIGWVYYFDRGIHTVTGGDTTFLSSIHQISNETPKGYKLFQNYPNPFNPRTVIGFELKKAGDVKIKVYSITGCEVFTLVNQRQTAGVYEVDMPGIGLSSGVYFYSLLVDNKRVDSKSMVLIK
jgi:photosystem II stability/assembly factor-like uncharacterized protein